MQFIDYGLKSVSLEQNDFLPITGSTIHQPNSGLPLEYYFGRESGRDLIQLERVKRT
jgi:hypothetical protein